MQKIQQNKTTPVQSLLTYDTRPGTKTGLFYNAPEPRTGGDNLSALVIVGLRQYA